jgi:hypothetical protein
MRIRSLVSFTVSFTTLACAAAALAQSPWTPPLTPDGHPDLQGNWVNKSATPLERPKQLEGRDSLSDAEVAELKLRAERLFKSGNNDFAQGLLRDDLYLAALGNIEQYKNPNATGGTDQMVEFEFDNRTSLIADPPDGKIPPYTPDGKRRWNALVTAVLAQRPPGGLRGLTTSQRCITWGIPMPRPGPYTSFYQIVQTPGYALIVMEAIHDARIIPLDGRPHLPQNMRPWNGDSIGHWDGEALVVDTANFSPQDNFMGSAENLHLVERFTRVAPDEIRYEMTVDDPTTWTKPWTAVVRLKRTDDKMYEFACHEGNFEIMETMLSGASSQEKTGK